MSGPLPLRRARIATLAAATMAAGLTGVTTVGLTSGAAHAAPPGDCTAYAGDAADLAGETVTGLTTSSGTDPDPFSGEVLGVIDDGIAPGVDMIMARLTSPEVDRVGIWAGMSGSPVYAPDGTLLGAVAYGLSFGPSTVAGITPASEMLDLLDHPAAAGARAGRVAIPASLQRKVVAGGDASAKAADAGLRVLKTPVGVSGVRSDRGLKKVRRTLGVSNVKLYRASRAPVTGGEPGTIVPGGNLAVSLTYGEFSYTGIGTVTAVCGGDVYGFGHPMTFEGPTSLTMQSASAVYIQEDPVFSGFKVANPTGPVGAITQDRLTGVAGPLGADAVPEAIPVTATASVDEDSDGATEDTHTGTTYVADPEFVPAATFYQALISQDVVFDRYGPGSGKSRFTIDGHTADGGAFSLERRNRFASQYDISYRMAQEAPEAAYRLYSNKFTDLSFDGVTVDSVINPEPREFRVGRTELRKHHEWVKLRRYGTVRAEPGDTLRFRVQLRSYRDRYGSQTQKVAVTIPDSSGRRFDGYLGIAGGSRYGLSTRGAGSFAELVSGIESSPRNDDLVASLYIEPRRGKEIRQVSTTRVGDVVSGGHYYELRSPKSGGGGGDCQEAHRAARGC